LGCTNRVRKAIWWGVKRKTLVITAPVILACVVFAPPLVTRSQSATRPDAATPSVDVRRTSLWSEVPEGEVPGNEAPDDLDLYGNEVTDAVAKYRFDASGSLYELHSPQTEVPKLAPPKT
jgi:hypothetical protein